jgi:hypothetical protein
MTGFVRSPDLVLGQVNRTDEFIMKIGVKTPSHNQSPCGGGEYVLELTTSPYGK